MGARGSHLVMSREMGKERREKINFFQLVISRQSRWPKTGSGRGSDPVEGQKRQRRGGERQNIGRAIPLSRLDLIGLHVPARGSLVPRRGSGALEACAWIRPRGLGKPSRVALHKSSRDKGIAADAPDTHPLVCLHMLGQ